MTQIMCCCDTEHASSASDGKGCPCSTIHDELKGATKSAALSALTAVAAVRAIALLCHRASALAAPASELRSVAGATSQAQLHNVSLCSQLHEVHRSLLMLLPKLAPTAAEVRPRCMMRATSSQSSSA